MKKLFRIAAGFVLAGVVVIATGGCVVVPYREAGLHVSTGGYYHGPYHHHHAAACPPHGW